MKNQEPIISQGLQPKQRKKQKSQKSQHLKYPPNGRWFSSYNWENGFYGTLDECLDRIQYCFTSNEFSILELLLADLKHQPESNALSKHLQHQENQQIKKVRAKVRAHCLKKGKAEGGFNSNYWYISFEGDSKIGGAS
jgi:hypothetical protein